MENQSSRQSILCKISVINSLNAEKQQELIACAKSISVGADEIIFEEGDFGHSMYVIQKGAVRILTTTEDGQTILLKTIKAGECFGEEVLQYGRTEDKRQIAAIAIESCELLKILAEDYQKILSQGGSGTYS